MMGFIINIIYIFDNWTFIIQNWIIGWSFNEKEKSLLQISAFFLYKALLTATSVVEHVIHVKYHNKTYFMADS